MGTNNDVNNIAKRLTLDEMYNIFMSDDYSDFRKQYNLKVSQDINGHKSLSYTKVWHNPSFMSTLYRHIAAEQILNSDYKNIDLESLGLYDPCLYLNLFELLMNPLFWVEPAYFDDIVIVGKVAVEKYDSNRLVEITDLVNYILEEVVLNFADNPSLCDEDMPYENLIKGIHFWEHITAKYDDLLSKIIIGQHVSYDDIRKANNYDARTLRTNLVLITERRNAKVAANLLKMLQNEWSTIKLWQIGLDNMSENEIKQFEDSLFHGFNDLLEEWKTELEKSDVSNPNTDNKMNSSFFNTHDIFTFETCERELLRIITESKNKANACREIMQSANIGYFDLNSRTDKEKAELINPWVAKTRKKYIFSGDDFRKARNNNIKK